MKKQEPIYAHSSGKWTITWEMIRHNHNVLFEDPVYETYVDIKTFEDMYGTFLVTLNGDTLTDYIDFFYQPSPLNRNIYLFVDADAKLDFHSFLVDDGLLPEMQEIVCGESLLDKSVRCKKENHQKQQMKKKEELNLEKKETAKRVQAQKTCEKLMLQLSKETNIEVRKNLERKIQTALAYVQISAP